MEEMLSKASERSDSMARRMGIVRRKSREEMVVAPNAAGELGYLDDGVYAAKAQLKQTGCVAL